MKREFREYHKNKNFLICVDSDGSAMNTMEIKHSQCFGPCLIEEFQLGAYKEQVLRLWNAVNLYSINRGVNRFLGLQIVLEYVNKTITPVTGLEELNVWISRTTELSNAALIRYLEDYESPFMRKVLRWSQAVSRDIGLLPVNSRQPYDGVADALLAARENSDIVVVSAANPDAMYEEWEVHGLAYFVNLILNQNIGTKEYCVAELLKKGYAPENVLMIGDAIEDLEVARKCGVCFYPIILHQEEFSWRFFETDALERFYEGTYKGFYETKLIAAFTQAFSEDYE